MKSLGMLFVCLLMFSIGKAQSKGYYFKVAYHGGMVINPGFSVGLGYSLLNQTKEKNNGNLVRREMRVGLSASLYHHRRLNTGLSIGPEIEFLRTGSKGAQFGLVFNSGYLRTFIPNTFNVDENGQVQKDKLSGTHHFIFGVGFRIGKDLSILNNKSLEWFVKPILQFQSPYFDGMNKYFLTEIGVNFKI